MNEIKSNLILNKYTKQISILKEKKLFRKLILPKGLDFSSNDYLGLSSSSKLRDALKLWNEQALSDELSLGSTGSRLLRGNNNEIEQLEDTAKVLFGDECLFFTNGYSANLSLMSSLPDRNDIIFYDDKIHASTLDGMKLSRAQNQSFKHNDLNDLQDKIKRFRQNNKADIFICIESLYSMDGDFATIDDFINIASDNNCFIIIDEAHTSFVYGKNGCGLLGNELLGNKKRGENVISLHTFGKALAIEGAVICASDIIKDILINRGRSFIYSTAPSPFFTRMIKNMLLFNYDLDEERRKIQKYIKKYQEIMQNYGIIDNTSSQIQKVIVGSEDKAIALQKYLAQRNIDIRAIRPPTVAKGTSRIRISLNLNISMQELTYGCKQIYEGLKVI